PGGSDWRRGHNFQSRRIPVQWFRCSPEVLLIFQEKSRRQSGRERCTSMSHAFRYGAWDGTQHVLDLDAEALLDAMSDDLLEEGDLLRALQRLFRQGAQNQDGNRMPGLQDLMQQLRQRRQQQLQR